MPILQEPRDVTADLEKFNSVLIVSCPMCPPMNLAMQTKTPFIEFFKHGIKTPAFEDFVKSVREPLEQRGVRTDEFTTRFPSPLMCVWTESQKRQLLERATGFEAVLVMGCSSALHTAVDVLKDTDCEIIIGMRMKGIANATMKIQPPMTVSLEREPLRGQHNNRGQDDSSVATRGSAEKSDRDS